MKDIDTLRSLLAESKELYLNDPEPFDNEYSWGVCNGIEIALALLEERPHFLIDKYKQYNSLDKERFPEYFL